MGTVTVRAEIDAAPILPLSPLDKMLGPAGTTTLPNLMAETVAEATACGLTSVAVKFWVTFVTLDGLVALELLVAGAATIGV